MPKYSRNAGLGLLGSTLLLLSSQGMGATMPYSWSEALQAQPLDLGRSVLVFQEDFNAPKTFNGPILWAKQHADVGMEKFDPPGGHSYLVDRGVLSIRAYRDAKGIHSGNVQSTSADQAYQGATIAPGKLGYTCTGCYFEARARFPNARGTWASFWLLTPDNPRARGHLEVDAIEYYGAGDRRGHHHTIHRWGQAEKEGHTQISDYTGMDELADFGWHTYGVDLRGVATLNGKPAVVIYLDRKEVARISPDTDYFTRPFYFNMTLSINAKDTVKTFPQQVDFDYVKVWK